MPDSQLQTVRAALADRYAVKDRIGGGGMATVFLAQDLRHERLVAIKVLRPELAASIGAERFLREIKITASLNHPHILPLLDSGDARGLLFYVMPYVEGESLRQRLNREQQLPIDDVVEITRQIAQGLNYAHEHDVVHRDIKPENILMHEGEAMIADFGIAWAVTHAAGDRLTATGLSLGTPGYMSPEQSTDRPVDGRSDVYSLACVVYEMLGGEPPYSGPTPGAILARQLAGEFLPLARIRTNVTAELDATLRRALDQTPADRFQTAVEFADAVEKHLARQRLRASLRQAFRLPIEVSWRRSIGVTALVALAAAIGWFVWRPGVASANIEPASIIVFPFRGSGEEAGTLGEGVADVLAAALEGTVGIRVADPETAWRAFRTPGGDRLRIPELNEAVTLARRTDAATVVLGTLTATGSQIVLSARLYDRDEQLRTTLRATAPPESLHIAVDRLAIDIVAALWERDTLPSVPVIEQYATDNLDALKAYLEAKSLKHRGQFAEAEEVISRAVELDSTFALANLELFTIRSWVQFLNAEGFTGLRPIIDRAMAHRDRLSERNRLVVEANRALDDTDGRGAASLFGRVLELDSLDWDALSGLAYTHFVYGWQLDKSVLDAIDMYERLAAADSTEASTYATLLRLATQAGLDESGDRYLAALLQTDTTSAYVTGVLGAYRAIHATPTQRDSIVRALASKPIPVVTTVLRELRSNAPPLAEQFFAELLVDSMPVFHQRVGLGARTQFWFGTGRILANDSVVQSGALENIRHAANGYFIVSHIAGAGDSAAAARAVAELEIFAPADSLEALLPVRDVWSTGWAVAAFHAVVGDTLKARRWQRALGALPQGDTPWDWTTALTEDIDARLAARRGDMRSAAQHARQAYDLWPIHSFNVLESQPEPGMRFHLAQILQNAGKLDEATRLYRSFVPPYNWAGFYTARSAFELGAIAEQQGDLNQAAQYYDMALDLWRLGDDEVQSWRAQAETRLARVLERIG